MIYFYKIFLFLFISNFCFAINLRESDYHSSEHNETDSDYEELENEENGVESQESDSESGISLTHFQTLVDSWLKRMRENRRNGSIGVETGNQTLQTFESMNARFGETVDAIRRTLMPLIVDNIYELDLSEQCLSTIFRMLDALQDRKEWPLRFMDASARLPFTGLLDGTNSDYGEYVQCLAINHTEERLQVKGKYCMTLVGLPMPPKPEILLFHEPVLNLNDTSLSDTFFSGFAKLLNLFYITKGLRLGLCVPNTCSAQELQSLSDRILKSRIGLNVRIGPKCETRDDKIEVTVHQIVSITIISTLLLISFYATFLDNFCFKTNPLIKCFSITQNTRKLFETNTQTKRLSVIHGLRVVSIVWILLGHVYLMQFFQIFHILRRVVYEMPKLAWYRYQPLKLGSFLQVETFLLLGGVTASYVTLELLSKMKVRFDYFAFLIFRWLRYTPALVGLLLFYFLLPHLGSGPIFRENIDKIYWPCEQYWWRNVLYFNNFYDPTGNCATHTWYLAVDFQLYALSPLVIFALKRSQVFGLLFVISVIVFGCFAAIIPPLVDSTVFPTMYSLNSLLTEDTINRHLRLHYWATYQHLSPYYLGILIGFLVHKYNSWKIPKILEIFVWILCLFSGIGTIFWTTDWMNSLSTYESPSRQHRLLFAAVHKTTWAILPAWIILCSAFGRPGPLGRFLSRPYWVPLSRLTYCIYLVQLIPIVLSIYSNKYIIPFDDFNNWSIASFSFVLSLMLSYVLYILFESPFSQMIKLLDNKRQFVKTDVKNGFK